MIPSRRGKSSSPTGNPPHTFPRKKASHYFTQQLAYAVCLENLLPNNVVVALLESADRRRF